jgi:Uma2 family endonuclease
MVRFHVMISSGLERIVTVEEARVTYTPAEYLARERLAETKSEYRSGEIVAMTGVSRAHNLITGNLFGELRQQLRSRGCETYMSDVRVRVSKTGLYTYPDIAIACEPIQFEDDQVDTLLNPVVVIEVLSPSTEAYDRGEKFTHYRRLDSLQEYLLVSQHTMRVERYVRRGEQWILTEVSAPDDVLEIGAIGCSIRLGDVYHRVGLPGRSLPTASDSGQPPPAAPTPERSQGVRD